MPKVPNLCAITYEVLEQALPLMGEEKIVAQLQHCKTLWNQYVETGCNADKSCAPAIREKEFNTQEDNNNVAA